MSAANAQLELVPDAQTPCVFGGATQKITVVWRNDGGQITNAEIRTQIFQTTSATTVLLADVAWKKLSVLPAQTVIESKSLEFPAVKAETKFLVQWMVATNQILGVTEVFVYPTNLLAELKPLAGEGAIGLFDPQNQLKPLLKNLGVDFVDLESSGLEVFSGKLAVVGPFESRAQLRASLMAQLELAAKRGINSVWLLPRTDRSAKLLPSFYAVAEKTNSIVVVQPELVADLPDNPSSQRNLIYFCKLALSPSPPALPNLAAQP